MPNDKPHLFSRNLARMKTQARKLKQAREYTRWDRGGRVQPPPFRYKASVLRDYARQYRLEALIETGTYQGDMTFAMKDLFPMIVTIELSPQLHAAASGRFQRWRHIRCLQGDSGTLLREVLGQLNSPALFWLDAHYSGGVTAKSSLETPIIGEMEAILHHRIGDHVILIDDAREFNGTHDYPTLLELERVVRSRSPKMSFKVEHDIVRIVPRP